MALPFNMVDEVGVFVVEQLRVRGIADPRELGTRNPG